MQEDAGTQARIRFDQMTRKQMEAALLAAEELAKAADDLCERYLEIATGPEDISRSDVDADYVSALRKVAAYRTATGAA